MERHAGCREGGKGYPCRAIRTKEHLYIRNFDPDRWPAGSPKRKYCVRHIRYGEVDPSPTKTVMMDEPKYAKLADLALGSVLPKNSILFPTIHTSFETLPML